MRIETVKRIVVYYKSIPGMLRLLRQERIELEQEYNGLGSAAASGMPHGSAPGKPTERMGMLCAESGISDRLREIDKKEAELAADEADIRRCLDTLNSRYKEIIFMRYLRGYSWAKISAKIKSPDSTARSWNYKALERLGETLEELPDVKGIAYRASCART